MRGGAAGTGTGKYEAGGWWGQFGHTRVGMGLVSGVCVLWPPGEGFWGPAAWVAADI